MAYIGEIGKRLKMTVTYKKSFEYKDYKFSYYGTTHYIHTFDDADGNIMVWKTTSIMTWENGDRYELIPEGSTVELTGTVKEHSEYNGTEQTVLTRCKFKVLERAKTWAEIQQEKEAAKKQKAEEQRASLNGKDFIWRMPYKQYKEHYADCETVVGSYDSHTDDRGYRHGVPTIDVIIREGRLKASGVRGQHYHSYEFTTADGQKVCYRAVCEENARKRMKKDYPESESWECTEIHW